MAQWYDRARGDAALEYLWQQINPVGTIVPLVYRRFEAGMNVWINTVGPNRQNTTLNWRTKGGKNEKTDSNIDSGNDTVIVSWNCDLRSYQR